MLPDNELNALDPNMTGATMRAYWLDEGKALAFATAHGGTVASVFCDGESAFMVSWPSDERVQ